MANPIRLEVRSERTIYPVLVGSSVLDRLPELLRGHNLDRDVFVVSCPPVWRLHGRRLRPVAGGGNPPALIPDGERAKSLPTVARLYDAFVRRRLDRTSTIVAFGGGVVGDVAGFAAASFLRGLRIVQVPTTLLSQVDSAIGGKVGVNLATGKNLVGAFHPPSLVVCDPDVLSTLPRREFRAGLYEVIKYGVIASRPLFDLVSSNLQRLFSHDDLLSPLIADCCRIKAEIVAADEREAGARRTLNFGHTVGHALEAITKYRRFRHGEAVAYGMLAAAQISTSRGLLADDDRKRVRELIVRMGPLPVVTDLRISEALEAIQHDKKVRDGRLHFVLANGIGATTIVPDVAAPELKAALRAIGLKK